MAKFVSKDNLETLVGRVAAKMNTKLSDPGNGEEGQVLVKTEEGTRWETIVPGNPDSECCCMEMTTSELDVILKGETPVPEVPEGPSYSTGTVDLGLPSGNLWATCNLGALKPEEIGLYYQWGDTKGYKGACGEAESDGNDDAHYFDWSKYKHCNGTSKTLTKYCIDSSYGTVDNKSVLEAEDDAVFAALGGQWRMPTDDDFLELIDNTDPGDGTSEYGWIEDYNGTGVNGLLRKSKTNGNTIFFPASGYCNGSSIYRVEQLAYIYSSSLYKYRGEDCYMFRFYSNDSDDFVTGLVIRSCGTNIRGVKPTKTETQPKPEEPKEPEISVESIDLGLPSGTIWATCNLGATSPEESGLYFQWGDTKGYKGACPMSESDGNDDAHYFGWKKYKYCTGRGEGAFLDEVSVTKYCINQFHGTVDNKTVLEPEDDAATVMLGGSWRIPSTDEFQELIDNTDPGDGANENGWIEDYNGTGIPGLLRKSRTNDSEIFFPAADTYVESKFFDLDLFEGALGDIEHVGNYWANSIDTTQTGAGSKGGTSLTFIPIMAAVGDNARCYGLPIRAVKSSN